MTAPPPTPPVVLDYASPHGMGTKSEMDRIVRDLIAGGAGPRKIRRFFRSDGDAMSYFCHVMQEQCSGDLLDDRCINCQKPAADMAMTINWRVRMRPRLLEYVASKGARRARLRTTHPVCRGCATTWRVRLAGDKTLRRLLVMGEVFTWFGLLALCVRLFRASYGEWNTLIAAVGFFVWLMLIDSFAGAATAAIMRRIRPTALHQIMPPEVTFYGLGPIVNRIKDAG